MADNIIKIEANDQQITDLNHNFRVLTQRIKALNLHISYLDMLRVTNVYEVIDSASADTQSDQDINDTRVRLFVAQCWNLLQNYSGVYLNGTNISSQSQYLFQWQGENVTNGSFIVKLPGNESLVIPAQEPQIYTPYTYNPATGIIEYTFLSTPGSNPEIPTPFINNTSNRLGYVYTGSISPNGGRATCDYPAANVFWYKDNEQVYLPASAVQGNTLINNTNMTLNYVAICQQTN